MMDSSKKIPDKWFWLGLFLLHVILRLPTFYTPILDVDETQFAGFAHVLMDGGLPFRHSLDTKPLGIYFFYWICFELFGRFNMEMVHVMTSGLQFITAFLLFRIFNSFQKPKIGKAAAFFFVIFSTTFIPKYLSTSINAVMVLFLVLSAAWMALAETKNKRYYDFMAGVLLGVGFLFKYTAGIQCVFFFLYTLPFWSFRKEQKHSKPWLKFLLRNTLFAIGFAIPFILHGLMLYKMGVWDDFVTWSILGSGKYISQGGSTISFWDSFGLRFGSYVAATIFLWWFFYQAFHKKFFKDSLPTMLFLWFSLSLVPVCIGGRFYPHYFIQLLPSLCGLAAIGFYKTSPAGNRFIPKNKRSWLTLIILPAALFFTMRLHYPSYLNVFPDDHIYAQQRIGQKLKTLADPKDKIFVWGFATGIYFHSELLSSSRFLWSDLLTGRTPGPSYARTDQDKEFHYSNDEAWRAFWLDMIKNQPRFFIDTSPANIHDYGRFPIKNYPQLQKFVHQNYEIVDQIEGVDIYKRR